jgi:hypothetical protein
LRFTINQEGNPLRVQVTTTVNEGKALIAEAIYHLKSVQYALDHGKVLLKGGTTVSSLAEKMVDISLRISGRVSARGTKSSQIKPDHPHSILIEDGKYRNADDHFAEMVLSMDTDDVIVVGANAIDVYGNAAMMAGAPGGGNPGLAFSAMACEGVKVIIACGMEKLIPFSAMACEGVKVIIACGMEKLIPGNINDIVKKTGRKSSDIAFGMSVGLIPLYGEIITEREAIRVFGDVEVTIIGKGGLDDGHSALTLILDGERQELTKVLPVLDRIRNAKASGFEKSLEECSPGSSCNKNHWACCYRNPKRIFW